MTPSATTLGSSPAAALESKRLSPNQLVILIPNAIEKRKRPAAAARLAVARRAAEGLLVRAVRVRQEGGHGVQAPVDLQRGLQEVVRAAAGDVRADLREF